MFETKLDFRTYESLLSHSYCGNSYIFILSYYKAVDKTGLTGVVITAHGMKRFEAYLRDNTYSQGGIVVGEEAE